MNEDTLKGKAKDVAGRVERQAGEWTGSEEHQAEGAAKQAEGKVQNAWGKAKDAVNEKLDKSREKDTSRRDDDERKSA
ncbi:MAG TPA: CsbD family protein [Terriglobales bacterium]|nr:CsbD family protein [Terriglobales bacterium]